MNKIQPIKPFKTLQGEARFWDTHDVSALFKNPKTPLQTLPTIESEKQQVITVRLQKSIKIKLKRIAQIKGINFSTLSRMWLIEKVQEFEERHT